MKLHRFFLALSLSLAAGAALAHEGHAGHSFGGGFAHPFSGVDHTLAMLAVGLYAASQRGTARWALPVGFLAAMLAGAGLAAAGMDIPLVEAGIAASVLVLGLLIAFVVRMPLVAALPLVATFALLHGHAHGTEAGGGSLFAYAAGFAIATGALHGAGYLLARWMPESAAARSMKRVLGGAIAATGLVLLGN